MMYFLNRNGVVISTCHVEYVAFSVRDTIVPTIEYVQADGDELEQACNILGRSLPTNRVFTFCGDDARTIAVNWS